MLLFGPNSGLLSDATRGYLHNREWEDEGRIHAKREAQHQNPLNDGLEFFERHTPDQNPVVHQMHSFIKIVVIS